MSHALLSVSALRCSVVGPDSQPIFSDLDLELNQGDVLVLNGRSGSGKTTLLKCLAHLIPYYGEVLLHGKSATDYGVPNYRTKVLYVPQRPSLLPSTPRSFLQMVRTFRSQRSEGASIRPPTDPIKMAKMWGIEENLWDRDWSNLSGGETQRMALAVALGVGSAEVVLLDEPTSALDADTTSQVEKYLVESVKSSGQLGAIICITHSEEQGQRIGTRFLHMEDLIHGHTNRSGDDDV